MYIPDIRARQILVYERLLRTPGVQLAHYFSDYVGQCNHELLHQCTTTPEDGTAHCTSMPNLEASKLCMTRVLCTVLCTCLIHADLRLEAYTAGPHY